MRRAHLQWFVIAPLVACTVDNDNGDPFGSGTVNPTTTINPTTTVTPTTGESSGSSGESSGSDDESSTGGVSTTMTGTTGMATLDDTGVGSSDDTMDPTGNGMQPMDGMYSNCLTADECGFNPILCITINDDTDGFCSETGCANPAVDCDPTPGGTAVPRCMPVNINDEDMQACALDCSNGMTCPVPMMCYNLTDIGEICG